MVKQSGFSLVAAIFVLVILGMMGSYMVSISVMQRQTTNYALQGARAYKAAQSGVQWAIRRILRDNAYIATCGAGPAGVPATGAGVTTNITLVANGLAGFDTAVTCNWTRHTDGGVDFCIFQINARATFGVFSQPDFVSRRLEAVISDNLQNSGC